MDSLLLWVPYRTWFPSPMPLLRRLLACGAGEISSLIPGDEDHAAQLRSIARARLIFIDQSFLNALHGFDPIESYQLERQPAAGRAAELWEAVLRNSAPRVLGLTYNDLHWLNVPGNPNFCAADLRGYAAHFQALVWGYEQWGEVAGGTLPVEHEPWMDTAGSPQMNWKILTSAIPARFDCVWSVEPQEIRSPRSRQYWEASVIGAYYSTRAQAMASAREAGLNIAPFRRLANLTARAIRLRQCLLKGRDSLDTALRRRTMDFVAARSAVNFVCGGGVRYFVRKYLELAAIGSCMAAWPAGGMRHYGFRDGEHLAVCGQPRDFGRTALWLLARPSLREAMGKAAQALVHAQHTVDGRAAQLLSWLRELARGRQCAGRYHEGEFQLSSV